MAAHKWNFQVCLAFLLALGLTACDALGQATPAPLPTVVLDSGAAAPSGGSNSTRTGGMVASGVVAPAAQAQLSFAISGMIDAAPFEAGDAVSAGQTLAQLQGQESLQAAVSAAQLELEQARQALADLTEQAEVERVQAMQQMVAYAQAVKEAQYALDNFTIPASQAGLEPVEALILMKQRLDDARQAFEAVKNRPASDSTRQDAKEALDRAQSDYNAAVRRLQYAYELEVAQTQFARAQRDYEIFSQGPDPDRLRLAQSRLDNAATQVAAAQAALDRLGLNAPFAGVVAARFLGAGEWVLPGQPVMTLVDLTHLRVETTDLSERDVPRVSVGQAVTVYVKALNQTLNGRVLQIAPLATSLGGDVVYKVTIELDSPPAALRAGMTVTVTFGE